MLNKKEEHLSESDLAILFEIKEKNAKNVKIDDDRLKHFESCQRCKESFNDLKEFLNDNYYSRKKPPTSLSYYYLAAAVIFIVVSVAYIFNFENDNFRFVENITYENLVGQQFRSEHTSIVSPLNGVVLKDQVSFKWETEEEAPYKIMIIDNQLNEVKIVETRETQVDLDISSFDKGLYYWKLANEHDLIYIGKFQLK